MIFKDSGIAGTTAVVTGGSRGIGREIVRMLAAEGADVTFFFLANQEAADTLEAECAEQGLHVTGLQVDVREPEACRGAVESVLERTGRIDVLVNNAGIIRDNLLPAFSDEEISDVLATNVLGVFHVTAAVAPVMMRQRGGAIVNISSVSAEKGGKGQTNYAASKGAVNALTRSLAVELAPRSIRVNAVAPGFVATEIISGMPAKIIESMVAHTPMGRIGDTADIAEAYLWLASDAANWVTGTTLSVDGGLVIGT